MPFFSSDVLSHDLYLTATHHEFQSESAAKGRPNLYDTRTWSSCERKARSEVAVRYTIVPLRFRPPPRVRPDLVAN
jgi:hypothetical protein